MSLNFIHRCSDWNPLGILTLLRHHSFLWTFNIACRNPKNCLSYWGYGTIARHDEDRNWGYHIETLIGNLLLLQYLSALFCILQLYRNFFLKNHSWLVIHTTCLTTLFNPSAEFQTYLSLLQLHSSSKFSYSKLGSVTPVIVTFLTCCFIGLNSSDGQVAIPAF